MHSRQRSKRRFALATAAVALMLLFAINYKMSGVISTAIRQLAAPMWTVSENLSGNTFAVKSTFTTKKQLLTELEALHKEIANLRSLKYENIFLRAQNSTLLSLASIGNKSNSDATRILARVYSTAGVRPYGTILISTNDTVHTGAIVLAKDGIAIGTVDSVLSKSAVVRLFSAANRSIDVTVGQNENPVVAQASGVGNGNFVISVPRESTVGIGDVVFSSAARGYPVGVVQNIERDPANSTVLLRARVPLNISALSIVLVE